MLSFLIIRLVHVHSCVFQVSRGKVKFVALDAELQVILTTYDYVWYFLFSSFYLLNFLVLGSDATHLFLISRRIKEGMMSETGTHERLIIELKGEYAKLYNMQASAFATSIADLFPGLEFYQFTGILVSYSGSSRRT